ncbi:hypothetical protein NEIFLAOT_02211 [Neisseria flavescens NRL30031/H210]|uniref:Uncharacterized protein n=1 Tax=Neisseria flavescens NRL30031/H210 TaxID=546264 RepID=C0EQF7_NEIFL|nr:hypothetical protein NEIFLAOT_02211 [Neisseria flavescens NRL30031/H210]
MSQSFSILFSLLLSRFLESRPSEGFIQSATSFSDGPFIKQ